MRSLRGRLTAGVMLVVAVVLIGGGIAVYEITVSQDRDDFDAALRRAAGNLTPGASGALGILPPGQPPGQPGQPPGGDSAAGAATAFQDAFRQGGDIRFVRAATPAGGMVAAGDVPPGVPHIADAPGARTVHAGGSDWRLVARRAQNGVIVEVAASVQPLSDRAARLRRIVIIEVLVGLLLAALATLLVTRFALRPLTTLREKAHDVQDTRDLALRVAAPDQPTEVAELAASLDAMLERLGRSADEREAALLAARRFAADAGHELRTPLQSVRANLDIARARGVMPEDLRVALDTASSQSDRLERLVDGLQSLARGEAGLGSAPTPVDLGDVADGAVFAARTRHPTLTITLDAPESGPVVDGDSDGLWRVLENLIENAALHGGSRVVVRVTDDVTIVVEDDGPGIPAADRERLVQRFARGRDATARGSGLGLAIVAAEARRHGGSLTLGESTLGGLRATVAI